MPDLNTIYMLAGIVAAVGGLLKYVFYSIDKHKDHFDERLDDHAEKIKDNSASIKDNEKNTNTLRDEMHKEYVHKNELNSLSDRLDNNFQAAFKKLDAVAKDVNRLIGRHQGIDVDE